ncbi:MAG: alpha-L-fucosidase [Firmicutes bacterium]|nr:alpha-L-fucosidase [Bacillota bacterium]
MDSVIKGVHGALPEDRYVKPENPVTLRQLEWFQDQKLALMMHWGIYSQLGMVESWALSDGDADWSRTGVDWETDAQSFKDGYVNLNKSFNPIRFQPEKWAKSAKLGGFKYLIFTTKHHDGFCMWDSKFTDYKTTHYSCPFSVNPRADIVAHVFESFRKNGLGIAAYFSKADWNTPYYWAKNQAKGNFMSRGPSYSPEENPELWQKFVDFTHNQIMELVTNYGKINILWFDAGWVSKRSGQDIKIEMLLEKARKIQPWLLSADRMVGGIGENYITPEHSVPSQPIFVPWESCIPMGNGFAYSYDDNFKSVKRLLHLLIDIVAKGGNLALNVAPQPDGRLPWPALQRMEQMGKWLSVYGKAIYGTRVCEPYVVDNFAFTQKSQENKVYAIYTNEPTIGQELILPYSAKKVTKITNLSNNQNVNFIQIDKSIKITVDSLAEKFDTEHIAEVFEMVVE